MKAITRHNYIGVYCSWCNKNGIAPLRYDILAEIFYGCETDSEFSEILNVLFLIQDKGLQLSFMDKTKINSSDALLVRLKIRLELFNRVPTATNMLLAYNLIEEITLNSFSQGKDITDEVNKQIERFDKLKNLALSTKYIAERKLAFSRSLDTFKKLTSVNV